ncbi:hypothetical protein [Nocardioides caldifontis]|uniref:hypothetical protein n=1 Tax=Nocardioides caldifontis TaxID=2588938 RepID=UPI0011DF8FC1|nr:hypothetical protein [Nocardioides caldifontis]
MKKLIAVPVVAILAAGAAASAAGFAGGVSASPIQSGDATDLTCASSARVIEWGSNDHLNPPNVVNARVQLNGSHCEGSALHVVALNSSGGQMVRATSGIIADSGNTDYARVTFESPINIADLNAVRITVDGGYAGLSQLPKN